MNLYLVMTSALCGALVMAVEFAGVRMLSVGYGATLAIWAAMISVTMLSLAVGYSLGGMLADRVPRPLPLFGIIMLSGVLIVLCPYARGVMRACYHALGLRWGVLASSLVVFLVPLGLLGMVSPYVIRLLSEQNRGVGFTAGGVYAVSTIGSVIGTLLVGLWLIPSLGVTACFRLAGIAALTAGAVGVVWSIRKPAAVLLVLAPALAWALPAPEAKVGLKYTAPDGEPVEILDVMDSPHGRIAVISKGDYLLLAVNGIVQTGIPKDLASMRKGDGLANQYYQELLPYMVDDPEGRHALIIGLAGGMTASLLQRYEIEIDAVDLDPDMIKTARKYFSFTGPAVAADGRRFLEDCRTTYDFCVIDTYSGDTMPFYLASMEAFESSKRVLKPEGILAINYIGAPGGSAFASIYSTLGEVFPHVMAIRGEDSDRVQTITLFASGSPLRIRRGWLDYRPSFDGVDPISETIEQLKVEPDTSKALILTDDCNSVDLLRAQEALAWRSRTIEMIGDKAMF